MKRWTAVAAEGAPQAVPGQGDGNGGNGDGERRRRRRGRRGGRRNRREEGEGTITPPEFGVAPIDEEVMTAVADFSGAPIDHIPHEVGARDAGDYSPARADAPADAVADAHSPEAVPVHAEAAAQPVHPTPTPAPAAEPSPAKEPHPAKEPTRRRSTVREPAPLVIGGSAAPPSPAPVPAAAEPEAAHHPVPAEAEAAPQGAASTTRRAGWWAKRMFGEKG